MATSSQKAPSGSGEGTSLERGLRVLLAVSDRGSVRVDSLVEQVGLPASTVYRYLRTLRELGLVEETEGWYRTGERLGKTGRAVSNGTLAWLAKPILGELAVETGETALVTVRAGTSALCMEQVESPNHMRMAFTIGQMLPLQAGAASRVLLAYAPPDVIERALAGPLTAYTPSTPDADKLRRQLENIRATGFATSRGEFIAGAFAVAVPVFHGDSVVAGLALAGPAARCTHRWQVSARPTLAEAARSLGTLLG
jgi:IclR family KDG regulon transcriptional repressor